MLTVSVQPLWFSRCEVPHLDGLGIAWLWLITDGQQATVRRYYSREWLNWPLAVKIRQQDLPSLSVGRETHEAAFHRMHVCGECDGPQSRLLVKIDYLLTDDFGLRRIARARQVESFLARCKVPNRKGVARHGNRL